MKNTIFYGILSILLSYAVAAQPSMDGRIVGGQNTTITEYPYQVSQELNGTHSCGGSILSPNVILLAAHCTVHIRNLNSMKIRAGSTIKEFGGVVREVERVFNHELWDERAVDYDVSLIMLKDPLPLSTRIQPIKLPDKNDYLNGQEWAVITGWGTTSADENTLPVLLQIAYVQIVEQKICNESYAGRITPQMICAGLYAVGGKDTCRMDSGGPLVSNNKLHGITSWGRECGAKWSPGVFTRVTAIREWIREKVNL